MKKFVCYGFLLPLFAMLACSDDTGVGSSQEIFYNFKNNLQGWTVDFSDYPTGDTSIYELASGIEDLPASLGLNQKGLKISGHNRSDDLFMFMKVRVGGLLPNQRYSVVFDIELASQYPKNSPGIGGSPGGSVFLKAGAVGFEPKVNIENNIYTLNLQKGDQSLGGKDMTVLGDIGIEGEEFKYTLIRRSNKNLPLEVETGASGEVWLVVGTDSGFEGLTTLYYTEIKVSFELK